MKEDKGGSNRNRKLDYVRGEEEEVEEKREKKKTEKEEEDE